MATNPEVPALQERVGFLEAELVNESHARARLESELAQSKASEAQAQRLLILMMSRVETLEDDAARHPPQSIRPALPSEFDGDRSRGKDFWNTCTLYMSMCPSEFPNDNIKISWILSYMKAGRAATLASEAIKQITVGEMPYENFAAFQREFEKEFFPEDEDTNALNKLESTQYYQGRRSVKE